MKIGLRIEVNTYRGTRDGVPRLMGLLKQFRAGATFLFSLGSDHTGRALGSLPRVPKMKCYGIGTLLSGTLLPGADIGARCRDVMRSVRQEGYEAGILALDRVRWLKRIAGAGEAWTAAEMRRARERYEDIFSAQALTHGAPGWRMNRYAYRYTQRLGYRHCSDTRGTGPFVPVVNGEIAACPQLPTTLPTLDEMIGLDGVTEANVAEALLEKTKEPRDHVYTLHAELEGMKLAPVFDKLLAGWKSQGYELVAMRDLVAAHGAANLPLHSVADATVAGRSGTLACQSTPFLADA